MTTRARSRRRTAWLLAAALLAVSATASAHELDHVTSHHDAACALHLYSGHHGALPVTVSQIDAPPLGTPRIASPATDRLTTMRRPTPPARAPPLRT